MVNHLDIGCRDVDPGKRLRRLEHVHQARDVTVAPHMELDGIGIRQGRLLRRTDDNASLFKVDLMHLKDYLNLFIIWAIRSNRSSNSFPFAGSKRLSDTSTATFEFVPVEPAIWLVEENEDLLS